jgi:hypothetical protein
MSFVCQKSGRIINFTAGTGSLKTERKINKMGNGRNGQTNRNIWQCPSRRIVKTQKWQKTKWN